MSYAVRTILYATDLGPNEKEVFQHAVGIARQFGAKLHILHVVQLLNESTHALVKAYMPADVMHKIHNQGMTDVRQEMHKRLDAFQQAESSGEPVLAAEVHVIEGPIAETILDQAGKLNADLIVMASHGHTAFGEIIMGSVAHKVLIKSTRPVLLVPVAETAPA